jgi:cyanophycinase
VTPALSPSPWPALAVVLLTALSACGGGGGHVGVIKAGVPVYEVPVNDNGIAVEAVARAPGRGPIILHGGGTMSEAIRQLIVSYSGPAPSLCVIDSADEANTPIYRLFDDFAGVRLVMLDLEAADVARPEVISALRGCTGYFFGGGSPQRLSEIMRPGGRDSPALVEIRHRFERAGALVSGSSAGAMIASQLALCECGAKSSVIAVTEGRLFTAPGFDFIGRNLLIDAHFFRRGLLGRHMFALARHGIPVGVGIDEEGAVFVPGDGEDWRVLNGGRVAIIRPPDGATAAELSGFGYSVLFPGDRFDPVSGEVAVSAKRTPTSVELAASAADDVSDESGAIRYVFRDTPRTRRFIREGSARIETILDREVSVAPL